MLPVEVAQILGSTPQNSEASPPLVLGPWRLFSQQFQIDNHPAALTGMLKGGEN